MKYEDRNKFDTRHGGAFDRGAADSYYSRPCKPHMFAGGTYHSEAITEENMTAEQVADYLAGYKWNELCGDKKDWG